MRDALLNLGVILDGDELKATTYPTADHIDLGDMNAKSRFYASAGASKYNELDGDLQMVFILKEALNSADSIDLLIQDSADGSSWATCLQGKTIAVSAPAGMYTVPLPRVHRRYLRAAATPQSTGVFAAHNLSAHIEAGPSPLV